MKMRGAVGWKNGKAGYMLLICQMDLKARTACAMNMNCIGDISKGIIESICQRIKTPAYWTLDAGWGSFCISARRKGTGTVWVWTHRGKILHTLKKWDFYMRGGGAGKVYHASILEFLLDKKEHYDVIVLNDVMEHMTKEEIFKVMDAVGNALKRGGRFLAKTPNMANPFVACVGRYIDITHETGFTEVSMKQVLKAAGFCGITVAGTDIYVLNPIVSAAAKTASKMINILLYVMSALYGRTSIRIFEKDLLAVGFKE